MRKIGIAVFFIFSSFVGVAQVDYRLMENKSVYSESKFQLQLYNHNFNRNYEYFNKFADGLTYFGSLFLPELIFNPSKDLSLHAGVFARLDYGNSNLYQQQLSFRINYHPGNWQIIAGRLDGNINHRLPEPMYNYDRIITNYLEFGNQFIYQKDGFLMDAWLNWENMIYKVSPEQEELSGGLHIEKRLFKNEQHSLHLPFSLLAYHQGGQIDTPDRNLITLVNTSIGLQYEYYLAKPQHYFWVDVQALSYNDLSNTKINVNSSAGLAFMSTLGFKFGFTSLSATYWKGNDFYGVHGAPVYQSIGDQINNPGYYQSERELLFIRLISDYNITENFSISARLEPYIDLQKPAFEFSNSLFFNYKQSFDLSRK
jgi:hypothetical protein